MVESLLSWWLSWFLLLSGPKDDLNADVFPLAILLPKGEKLALASLYLRSLYERVDNCIENMVCSVAAMMW